MTACTRRRRAFHIFTDGCPAARPARRPSICAASRFAASSSAAVGGGCILARACAPVRPLLFVIDSPMVLDAGSGQCETATSSCCSSAMTHFQTLGGVVPLSKPAFISARSITALARQAGSDKRPKTAGSLIRTA